MLNNHGRAICACIREVYESVTVLDRDLFTMAIFKRFHLFQLACARSEK